MSASAMTTTAFRAGLLFCCLHNVVAGEQLATPHNVTMVTLNTNYTLSWDWDEGAAESHAVTFTTQYVPRFKLKFKSVNWNVVCNNASPRSCDLTHVNLHFKGIYVLRVRANLKNTHSNWVQKEFCPDKDADVGPPSRVDLAPAGGLLDVIIKDPLSSTNTSMKELIQDLYYQIVYWEDSPDAQASGIQTLSSQANVVTLPNLKAWTMYCVRVQSGTTFYNKSSSFTSPQCRQTEGVTPWWLIFLCFLGSLGICFIIMLVAICGFYSIYKMVKAVFFPRTQLPPHFQELLCDSPDSDIPRLLTSDSESELLCDKVIICPESVLEVHHAPSGLEPDSSGRHSRQDSSSSRDSGVYSTGGSSGLQQPSSGLTSAGPETSSIPGQGCLGVEQMKMQDLAPGLKSRPAVADEGVVDMFM
uniref:interleukin-10 receptor subunit beta n=1 Tax=Scatophagus argus TaxID=75038 RepID=UPI001ED7E6BF|nr:interleukin-10 receptor subunit beta [Scatophagus argus]